MPSPHAPTWALQLAAVLCLVTAGVCGRYAERHRSASAGAVTVLSLFTTAALVAVLGYRMSQ